MIFPVTQTHKPVDTAEHMQGREDSTGVVVIILLGKFRVANGKVKHFRYLVHTQDLIPRLLDTLAHFFSDGRYVLCYPCEGSNVLLVMARYFSIQERI